MKLDRVAHLELTESRDRRARLAASHDFGRDEAQHAIDPAAIEEAAGQLATAFEKQTCRAAPSQIRQNNVDRHPATYRGFDENHLDAQVGQTSDPIWGSGVGGEDERAPIAVFAHEGRDER